MAAKQVLIIENDVSLQQMLENMLGSKGFGVCQAYDGEQGLRTFAQQAFDLVLLDIMLPQTSGWEVLRQVRRRSETPVIISSALFRAEYLNYAAELGADFLMKPFSRAALLAAMEAVWPWITPPLDKNKTNQVNGKPNGSAALYYRAACDRLMMLPAEPCTAIPLMFLGAHRFYQQRAEEVATKNRTAAQRIYFALVRTALFPAGQKRSSNPTAV